MGFHTRLPHNLCSNCVYELIERPAAGRATRTALGGSLRRQNCTLDGGAFEEIGILSRVELLWIGKHQVPSRAYWGYDPQLNGD